MSTSKKTKKANNSRGGRLILFFSRTTLPWHENKKKHTSVHVIIERKGIRKKRVTGLDIFFSASQEALNLEILQQRETACKRYYNMSPHKRILTNTSPHPLVTISIWPEYTIEY